MIGSMRLARRAGNQTASSATMVEHDRHADEDERVALGDAEQERGDEPRQAEGRAEADDDADERQAHALEDDHVLHLRRLAPSASRMPISCVRCSTEYAIRP